MLDSTPSHSQDSLTGKLIVASTLVQDAVLGRSVSLVVHQDSNNLFAVLLNRPMATPPGLAKLFTGEGSKGDDSAGEGFDDAPQLPAAIGPARWHDGETARPSSGDDEPDRDGDDLSLTENTISEVTKTLGMIHFGGPMSGPVVAVHNSREHAEAEAGRGVYVAAQKESLETLIKQKPGSYRLIVGHLGWTREQFQAERDAGYWHLIDATDDNVFSGDQDLWPSVIRRATTQSMAHWMGIRDTPLAAEVN